MNKMQKIFVAVALASANVAAHAALPAEATATFSSISGNVTDVLAVIWPIVATLTGGFVLIKLFKKGASKAV